MAAVYDGEAGREVVELREAEPWLPEPQLLRDALAEIVDFQLGRHRRLSELGGAGFYRDHHREFSLAGRPGAEEVENGIRRLLQRHADEVRLRDLDEAAFLVARGVSAVVRLALDERPEKLGCPAFRDALVDLLVRYVCRD